MIFYNSINNYKLKECVFSSGRFSMDRGSSISKLTKKMTSGSSITSSNLEITSELSPAGTSNNFYINP
jgi:hypothetical protein